MPYVELFIASALSAELLTNFSDFATLFPYEMLLVTNTVHHVEIVVCIFNQVNTRSPSIFDLAKSKIR